MTRTPEQIATDANGQHDIRGKWMMKLSKHAPSKIHLPNGILLVVPKAVAVKVLLHIRRTHTVTNELILDELNVSLMQHMKSFRKSLRQLQAQGPIPRD